MADATNTAVLGTAVFDSAARVLRSAWRAVAGDDSPGSTFEASLSGLPPYDPHGRMLWSLWRMASMSSPSLGDAIEHALPKRHDDQAEFLLGLIEGGADEATKRLRALVNSIGTALKAAGQLYGTVYDTTVWVDLVEAAFSGGDYDIENAAMEDVRSRHPEFFAAVLDMIKLSDAVDKAISQWTSTELADGLYVAIGTIGSFVTGMLEPVAQAIETIWDGFLKLGDDYRGAGRLVGTGIVAAVIDIWQIVDMLMPAAGVEQLTAYVAEHAAEDLLAAATAELQQILTIGNAASPKVNPKLIPIIRKIGYDRIPSLRGIAIKQAKNDQELFAQVQAFAHRIGAYRDVKKMTSAYGRGARALGNLKEGQVEWTVIRFDAHHIIEDHYLDPFAADVLANLGWKSRDDADCLALLYEEHILGVPGKLERGLVPRTPSLSIRLRSYVDAKKPTSLLEVVDAHYEWYLDPKSAALADRFVGGEQLRALSNWFDDIYAKLGTVRPPMRP